MEALTNVCCNIIVFIFIYGTMLICGIGFIGLSIYLIKAFVDDVRTWGQDKTQKDDNNYVSWND